MHLYSVLQRRRQRKRAFVFFCNDKHDPEACDLEIEKKKSILKRQGRCFRCLIKNHVISSCKSTIKCICGSSKHNRTICFKFSNSQKPLDKLAEVQKTGNAEEFACNANDGIVTASTHVNKNKNKILLQTCFVRAKNKQNNKY